MLRSSTVISGLISIGLGIGISCSGAAEIIPDRSLPDRSRVRLRDRTHIITGGTQQNDRLFHSFETFSIQRGETAYFRLTDFDAIDTIFARVTGSDASTINGRIQADGSANLFLINPNGIIFGPSASLDLGGSFLATTADRFFNSTDGTQFSAVEPQSPLLTVSTPIGVQFGENPQPITNRSSFSTTEFDFPIGLRVADGETLALVGGEINFLDGTATAFSGRIELAALNSSSSINLAIGNSELQLDHSVQMFQDIRLIRGLINTSGAVNAAGSISLQGSTIALSEGSLIIASTRSRSAQATGGTLSLIATESVILDEVSNIATFATSGSQAGDILIRAGNTIQLLGSEFNGSKLPTSIGSQVTETGWGRGGDVILRTRRLVIADGAAIEASTRGQGQAGNIDIWATESIELSGANVYGAAVEEQITSGIFSQVADTAVQNAGNAGTIILRTRDLSVLEGAQISTAARFAGRGGNILIEADAIRVSGESANATQTEGRSGIFVSAEPTAQNDGGQLRITANQLTVENNGEISANNRGGITDSSEPTQGGTIRIDSRLVSIQNGGEIRATSFNDGLAGDIIISADRIELDRGILAANTRAGTEPNANIRLRNFDRLTLQNQSQISARAQAEASGGNIFINAPEGFVIAAAAQNNDIIASAEFGSGGAIVVNTQGLVGLSEQRSVPANSTSDLDASSEFGDQGTVTIVQPNVDPSRGLVELPAEVVDAARQIVQACPTSLATADRLSEFVISGRGGLPPSPDDVRGIEAGGVDWVTIEGDSETLNDEQEIETKERQIQEAQGWQMNAAGEVTLVAAEQAPSIVRCTGG